MTARVWLRSAPGFYEQYDGKVDLCFDSMESFWKLQDDDQLLRLAVEKLQRTSFPDRGMSMWKVDRVEVLPG